MKENFTYKNPLELLGETCPQKGGFGAVLARAGTGKTSILVQIAISALLAGKHALHISIDEPVGKVCLWYEEVMKNLAAASGITELTPLWDGILPRRFIMTFKVGGFSVPKLEERIAELTEQEIFLPETVLIDGLTCENSRPALEALKNFAASQGFQTWFTFVAHRHENPEQLDVPPVFEEIADLFETAILFKPEGEEFRLKAVKGCKNPESSLLLDPATMLVRPEV